MERDSARSNLIAVHFAVATVHMHTDSHTDSPPARALRQSPGVAAESPSHREGVRSRWSQIADRAAPHTGCRWVPLIWRVHATPREFELLHIVAAASPRQRH